MSASEIGCREIMAALANEGVASVLWQKTNRNGTVKWMISVKFDSDFELDQEEFEMIVEPFNASIFQIDDYICIVP